MLTLVQGHTHTHTGTPSFHHAELLFSSGLCIPSLVGLLGLCLELSLSLIWLIPIHLSALSWDITPSGKTPICPFKSGRDVWCSNRCTCTFLTRGIAYHPLQVSIFRRWPQQHFSSHLSSSAMWAWYSAHHKRSLFLFLLSLGRACGCFDQCNTVEVTLCQF